MSEERAMEQVQRDLADAKTTLESLESRMRAGEEIDEKELNVLARAVAVQMESIRAALEAAIGGIDAETMERLMRERLSPEEYVEWTEGEEERRRFRDELAKEAQFREQVDVQDEGADRG